MHLPGEIQTQIEQYVEGMPLSVLEKAAAQLSEHYRAGRATAKLRMEARERVAAYLVTRFPATYAAVTFALAEVADAGPRSLLDIGAGAGAAALAAAECFDGLERMTLMEADGVAVEAGKSWLPEAEWRVANFTETPFDEHDVVMASYSLGELKPAGRAQVVERAWKAALRMMIVIEPGSTAGFAVVRECRDRLIGLGAHTVAPCPGDRPCPVAAGDWCHFAARLERSRLHRRLKHGQLSYEDEKFSYAILSKQPVQACEGRIVRRPAHHPGLIELTVCHGDRISTERIQKRERNKFGAARKAAWGERWP